MAAELPSEVKKGQTTPKSLKKKQQIKTLKQRALEYELGKLLIWR